MRLHVDTGDHSHTVAIVIDDATATVRELAVALGFESDGALVIDGAVHPDPTPISDIGLVEGSVVSVYDPSARSTGPLVGERVRRVGVESGIDAGAVAYFGTKAELSIGRDAKNDFCVANETVSGSHAVLTWVAGEAIELRDLGSHNGTWIDGGAVEGPHRLDDGQTLRLGSSLLRVETLSKGDRPVGVSPMHSDEEGRILINRPPRGAIPSGPQPLVVPKARPTRKNPFFSVVSLLVPLIFAAVMIKVTGRWQYAMFALLSPLMLIGTFVTNRRKVKKERADDEEDYVEALARLRNDFARAEDVERRRRSSFAPDLLEIRRRVELPSSLLWERRFASADAMTLRLGRGDLRWQPSLTRPNEEPDEMIEAIIAEHATVQDIELLADLRTGPLGLVGSAALCAGAGRSALLQLTAHHGPADLSVVVLTTDDRLDAWRWAAWLPHVLDGNDGAMVLAGDAAAAFPAMLLDRLDEGTEGFGAEQNVPLTPGFLLVVDDVELLHGRSSPTRQLLRNAHRHIFGIVLAGSEDQLPASTATVAHIDHEGVLSERATGVDEPSSTGVADVVTLDTASEIARALARFEDPELAVAGGALPRNVRPDALWGERVTTPAAIRAAWQLSKESPALEAAIGVGDSGRLAIDLVHDGPHGLVAGTTGAGKSEFLRTFVIGLAIAHDPDDLVFVLIDYKGGSAFDHCAQLPHVVGMVTDLDDHLAERALQSLEAELHYREQLLRDGACTDIAEYRKADSPLGPLPRLVVIIDEFATLRAELPEFVTALVGIAQRGRSLGVHLILATQRPSGAVDANIRANTNLRIALRVQDSADSSDVIDTKEAASIDRATPGRAYVRRGQSDLVSVQTAFVSGPRLTTTTRAIRIGEATIGSGSPPIFPSVTADSDETDLEVLVRSITGAAAAFPPSRRPWLDDLEADIDVRESAGLSSGDGAPVVLAVGDDPDHQRRITLGWNPAEGHLAVYGVLGSGVTTTLRSLVHRLGPGVEGRPTWVFVADHGAGGLAGIDALDHVSCRLDGTDVARHARLITILGDVLDERRELSAEVAATLPLVVLVIDGLASFCELTDTVNAGERSELFNRIVRDGPGVGITIVAGATRVGELPRSLDAAIRQFFAMELADPGDYLALGIKNRNLPAFRPGRALVGTRPTVAQIIDWSTALGSEDVVPSDSPPSVEQLPDEFDRRELTISVTFSPELSIPFGIDDSSRGAATLVLRGGEHALIAGPSGSGRTTTLRTISRQLRDADPALVLVAISPREDADLFDPSVFDAAGTLDGLEDVLEMAKTDERRWVILIDDADQVDTESGALYDIVRNARSGLTVIASGRSTAIRQTYGHWLRYVRGSGVGVILNPDNGVDGELLTVRLPRGVRLPAVPGRGYRVAAGEASVIQVAR